MPTAHESNAICGISLAKKLDKMSYLKRFVALKKVKDFLSLHPRIGRMLCDEIMHRLERGLWPEIFRCEDPLVLLRQLISKSDAYGKHKSWVEVVTKPNSQLGSMLFDERSYLTM